MDERDKKYQIINNVNRRKILVEKPLNFDPFGHAELSLLAKI